MKKQQFTILVLSIAALVSSCKHHFEDHDKDPKPNKDPKLTLLAGNGNGKTWRICADPQQTKICPYTYLTNPDVQPYWHFPNGLTEPWDKDGWLRNEFTFSSKNNQFTPKNQWVRAHWGYLNVFWGYDQEIFVDSAVVDPDYRQTTFELKNENTGIGTGYTLDIAQNGYIGLLCNKQSKYYVMSINKDTMRIAHLFKEYQIENGQTVEYPETLVWQTTLVAQ